MEVDFGILGPLEVRDEEGNPISIPGARERALLADLLIHAGEVVSADRLIEDLWADHQPDNAPNALQAVISRVRKALGPRGQDLVVTRVPGYVLAVEADRVDWRRFERLVAEGRRLAEHAAPGAAARLGEGLALWRGPPLADFAYQDFAQLETMRLEEARLAALEDLIDAQLGEGRHAEAIGELEKLVAANPLRERLRGQLMLALYRSGRQVDALAAYRDARDVLQEELGLDPSPQLRELEQAILRQDPALAAPARPGVEPRHNLPARITSFVGRDRELRELAKLVGKHRLVTLTGPGGAGKSSLALELAAALVDSHPGGVWVVELAPLADEPSIEEAVAAAFGVREGPQAGAAVAGSPTDRVIDFLCANDLLLILDNCEHLVESCARLADRFLHSAQGLTILATSREALGIPGEVVWPIPPLGLPDGTTPLDMLPVCDALRLFEERAASSRPSFALDAETTPVVAEICRRLDGMPLAIELAAARVRTLPPVEIAARLKDRFRLLTGGGRTAVPRQRTLQATVDWSYGLLGERERLLFQSLSVFSDGWTLEAAEEVCCGGELPREDVLDLLTRLVDQSMVVSAADGARFHMLETLREYAHARLEEPGATREVRRRHVAYYLALGDRVDPETHAAGWWNWMRGLEREAGNFRTALQWALEDGDTDSALALGGALSWYWFMGNQEEGRRWLRHILETAPASRTRHRARALIAYALLQVFHLSDESETAAREALSICGKVGDRWAGATAKLLIVLALVERGDVAECARLLDQAELVFRELNERRGQALVWAERMVVARHVGDLDGAIEAGNRSLELFREVGDTWGVVSVLTILAEQRRQRAEYRAALSMHEEALALARASKVGYVCQESLARVGTVVMLLGEEDRALEAFEESLALASRFGYRLGAAMAHNGMGTLFRRQGDLDLATGHFENALAIHQEIGGRAGMGGVPILVQALSGLGFCKELSGDLVGAERCHREALEAGREHAVFFAASCIEGLACVAAARGDAQRAAHLLGSAARIRQATGSPLPYPEQADVDRAAAAARLALGDEAFQHACEEGNDLTIDEVLHEILA